MEKEKQNITPSKAERKANIKLKARSISIPLSLMYLLANFHTILIFLDEFYRKSGISYEYLPDTKFMLFLEDKFGDIDGIHIYFDIVIFTETLIEDHINVILAFVITALFVINVKSDINNRKICIFKWIIYFLLLIAVFFIAFAASSIYLHWLPS